MSMFPANPNQYAPAPAPQPAQGWPWPGHAPQQPPPGYAPVPAPAPYTPQPGYAPAAPAYGQPTGYGVTAGYPPAQAQPAGMFNGQPQPVNPVGMFTGADQAKVTNKAAYLGIGTYWLRIDKCKCGTSRSSGLFAAIECTVVKVINAAAGRGHSQGAAVTKMFMKKSDYFLSDSKKFVAGIFGINPADSVTEQQINQVWGPQQPAVGMVVEVQGYEFTTKKNLLFTDHKWLREVPAAEVLRAIDPQIKATFFPGDVLERTAAAQAQQAQPQQAMTPSLQAPPPPQPQYPAQPQQFQPQAQPQYGPAPGYGHPAVAYPNGYPQQPPNAYAPR